jgi:hypothetical protein
MTVTIARRELLAALGGAAAEWPLGASAHQPAMPVIGYMSGISPRPYCVSEWLKALFCDGHHVF